MVNLLALAGGLLAADANSSLEDSLFAAEMSGPPVAVVTDSVRASPGSAAGREPERSGPGISGQVQTSSTSRIVRGDLPEQLDRYVGFYPAQEFETAGRVDLDAPLPDRSRAHLTLELDYLASTRTSTFSLREAFVDAHLFDVLAVRAGKQVLQWSRCQLWTPADLVNVEAPRFQARLGAREGATGVRAHLPVGAQFNVYGFADLGGVSQPSDIAAVGRVEFTLPHTEVGLTWRHKDGERDVPALDLSTGIDRWQLAAEAAWLAPGTLMEIVPAPSRGQGSGVASVGIAPVDKRALQVSVSVSRPFDALGRTDRLRVGAEGFWNPEGERGNVFDNLEEVDFSRPVLLGGDTLRSGPRPALRVFGGGYRPYQLNRWYVMGWAMLSDAFVASGSLKASAIGNLDDGSWQGLLEWSWQSLHGLTAAFSASVPFGSYPGEFTWTSDYATLRADLGVGF